MNENWATTFFDESFVEIFSRLQKFECTEEDASALIALLDLPKGSHILDVPCGFGRFSGILARQGFQVTGIDLSESLIRLANEWNSGPKYILADMRYPPEGPFDCVINLWTSFGYFDSPDNDLAALRAWYSVLRPGGQIIMELTDLERAESQNRKGRELTSFIRRETNGVIEELMVDWEKNIASVTYKFQGKTRECRTRIYAQQTLVNMFEKVGFVNINLFGGFDKRKKQPSARLVIHAKRP